MLTTPQEVKNENATYVHPYDDLDVLIGQGTVGLEILEDLKDVDMIISMYNTLFFIIIYIILLSTYINSTMKTFFTCYRMYSISII